MTTYCVDLTAGSNGTGSEASPLNALPANFSAYVDGDSFLLKAGIRHSFAWSGSSADALTVNRRLTFGRYGTGPDPVLAASYTGSGGGRLFRIFNSGCVIEDVEIDGVGTPYFGIYTQSAFADFTARRLNMHDIRGDASNFQNAITVAPSSGLTGTLIIEDCTFDTIGNDGVVAWCTGQIYLRRNTVRNVSMDATNGDCLAVTGNCALLVVEANDLDHSNRDTKQCFIQDGGTTGYAQIHGNRMRGYVGSDSATHTGVYLTLPGVISSNFIETWRSGVFCNGPNIAVMGNVIRQGGGSASTGAIWGASAGMRAYNNTIVRDLGGDEVSDAAIRNTTSNATNEYRNNIIAGFSKGVKRGAAAVDSHNLFYDVGTNVVNAADTPQSDGAGSLTADPLLDASYRLLEGSPCIGAGTYIKGAKHMGGLRQRMPADIGAYRYRAERSIALNRPVA